jgi:hypothetical protein
VSSVGDAPLADLRQLKGPNRLSRKMRLNFNIHVRGSPSSKELFVHKRLPKIWSWSDVEKIMALWQSRIVSVDTSKQCHVVIME